MSVSGDNEDAALVHAMAHGDEDAFSTLYRRYLPLVTRWCLRETGSRELAADLSAEVFAAAIAASRRYRTDQGAVTLMPLSPRREPPHENPTATPRGAMRFQGTSRT